MAKRKASVDLNREDFEAASATSRSARASLDQFHPDGGKTLAGSPSDVRRECPQDKAAASAAEPAGDAPLPGPSEPVEGADIAGCKGIAPSKQQSPQIIQPQEAAKETNENDVAQLLQHQEAASIFGTLFSKPYTNPFATVARSATAMSDHLDGVGINLNANNLASPREAPCMSHSLFSSNSIFNLTATDSTSTGTALPADSSHDCGGAISGSHNTTCSETTEEGRRTLTFPGEEDEEELFVDFNVIVYHYVPTVVPDSVHVDANVEEVAKSSQANDTAAATAPRVAPPPGQEGLEVTASDMQLPTSSSSKTETVKVSVEIVRSNSDATHDLDGAQKTQKTATMKYTKKGEGVLRLLRSRKTSTESFPAKEVTRVRIVARQKGTWRVLVNTPLEASPSYDAVPQVSRGWGVRFVAWNSLASTVVDADGPSCSKRPPPQPPQPPQFSVHMLRFTTAAKRDEFLKAVDVERQAATTATSVPGLS